ncbi:MAG TPA: AraC family transcriptional regulator, partial [Terriglobales bacterium]|nr:AraC family transcriptional regulator [Terriglobales bacterium]
IPATAVVQLMERSAQAAAIEDFGLRMAETRQLGALGPLGLVWQEQPTLRRALQSTVRYLRLQNEALVIHIEETAGLAIIHVDITGGVPGFMRQATELVVGILHRTLRAVLGATWKPVAFLFTHPAPARLAAHVRVLGAPVKFNQDFNGIVCQAPDLDVSIPTYDPFIAEQVRRYLDSKLLHSDVAMPDKVRKLVVALLPSGACSVERVAQHMGVDRRTLHRHLAQHGQSYLSVVDTVREELVIEHISNGSRSLSDVATLAGFSSLSAFSRWFRIRFGCSVSAWRIKNLQDKTAPVKARSSSRA